MIEPFGQKTFISSAKHGPLNHSKSHDYRSYATPLKALCYWVAHHNEVYAALKFAASSKNGEMVENLLPLLGSSAVALDILSMGVNQNDPIIVSCALKHVSSHSEDDVDAAWSHVLRMKSVEMLDEALRRFPNSRLPPVSLHHLADPVFKDRWNEVLAPQSTDDVTSGFLRGAVLLNSWGALQYVATRADIQSTNVLEWVREYQVVEIVEPLMDLFTDQQIEKMLASLPAKGIDPHGDRNPALVEIQRIMSSRRQAAVLCHVVQNDASEQPTRPHKKM